MAPRLEGDKGLAGVAAGQVVPTSSPQLLGVEPPGQVSPSSSGWAGVELQGRGFDGESVGGSG